LLLAFASRVILISGLRGTHDKVFLSMSLNIWSVSFSGKLLLAFDSRVIGEGQS
jgi:hypothetical protein